MQHSIAFGRPNSFCLFKHNHQKCEPIYGTSQTRIRIRIEVNLCRIVTYQTSIRIRLGDFFNRDPMIPILIMDDNGFLQSPHKWVVFHPQRSSPKLTTFRGLFFIAQVALWWFNFFNLLGELMSTRWAERFPAVFSRPTRGPCSFAGGWGPVQWSKRILFRVHWNKHEELRVGK